jgi:hypothetical protein
VLSVGTGTSVVTLPSMVTVPTKRLFSAQICSSQSPPRRA